MLLKSTSRFFESDGILSNYCFNITKMIDIRLWRHT